MRYWSFGPFVDGMPTAIWDGMINQRFYINGKLHKTSKGLTVEKSRRYLDNIEREWSKHLAPLTLPGEFDFNKGHEVTRVSTDELLVTTTGNKKLRFVNIEVA
jgi:hypothetical protein